MEILKKPIWLLCSIVLPQMLLLYLFTTAYHVIESMLLPDVKEQWLYMAVYYGTFSCCTVAYVVYGTIRKLSINVAFSCALIILSGINIALFFYITEELIPREIPRWMFTSSDLKIYPYSFIIPGLMHGIILMVLNFSTKSSKSWINLLYTAVLPFGVFILFHVADWLNLGNAFEDFFVKGAELTKYIGIFLLVLFACFFLFFVFRFVYLIGLKKDHETNFIARLFFCLLFPIAGLLFNNHLFKDFSGELFGYFHHPAFYTLAVINGVVLAWKNPMNKRARLVLFVFRGVTFSFTVYFFILFAPWLPISILAVLLVGFGFLMLTPILNFIYHIRSLVDDVNYLKKHFKVWLVYGIFLGSFISIPLAITINFHIDKIELTACLSYLYDRPYGSHDQKRFNEARINRLLDHIDRVKHHDTQQQPFIDSYYNAIVLDNLLLSEDKIKDIASIISGKEQDTRRHWRNSGWTAPTAAATLEKVTSETKFNEKGKYYESWIHLGLSSEKTSSVQYRDYVVTSPGTFVSNYYLIVEGKKKYGILAEKRTAKWVYDNITRTRLDPGILENIAPNRFRLSVFPVSNSLSRQTGIKVIHKYPTVVKVGSKKISLSVDSIDKKLKPAVFEEQGVVLISPDAKQELRKIKREPQHHFLLACVDDSSKEQIVSNVNKLLKELNVSIDEVVIGTQNYNYTQLQNSKWEKEFLESPSYGGFYPEHQVKSILLSDFKNPGKKKPVIFMISHRNIDLQRLNGFADLKNYAAGNSFIYQYCEDALLPEDTLLPAGLSRINLFTGESTKQLGNCDFFEDALEYEIKGHKWIIPDDDCSTLLQYCEKELPEISTNQYMSAVGLFALGENDFFHPEEDHWLPIVKRSLQNGIVSKFTSYITVETEAQEKMLLHKQQQVLQANKNLDLGEQLEEENIQEMSEPSILVVLVLIMGIWFVYRKRKNIDIA